MNLAVCNTTWPQAVSQSSSYFPSTSSQTTVMPSTSLFDRITKETWNSSNPIPTNTLIGAHVLVGWKEMKRVRLANVKSGQLDDNSAIHRHFLGKLFSKSLHYTSTCIIGNNKVDLYLLVIEDFQQTYSYKKSVSPLCVYTNEINYLFHWLHRHAMEMFVSVLWLTCAISSD